jgi:hypothetical protein
MGHGVESMEKKEKGDGKPEKMTKDYTDSHRFSQIFLFLICVNLCNPWFYLLKLRSKMELNFFKFALGHVEDKL